MPLLFEFSRGTQQGVANAGGDGGGVRATWFATLVVPIIIATLTFAFNAGLERVRLANAKTLECFRQQASQDARNLSDVCRERLRLA